MKIDIGGGSNVAFDHINLDPVHGQGEWKRWAQDLPWPTGDNTVEHIHASHVLEHIPAGMQHRVAIFNECHRVMAPGGIFEIKLPLLNWLGEDGQRHYGGWEAVADPTHVSFWCYPESFLYFTGEFAPCADYGIRPWVMLHGEVRGYGEAYVQLAKP